MATPVRFALVGSGAVASAYEAAFRTTGMAKIVAVCDVRSSVAQASAHRIGCVAFASLESLLRHGDFEAAVVCTPPATHEAITCTLLQNRKHVLCEKPLATSVGAARRMLAASRESGALLTMASKFRYATDVRMARALVRADAIGELVFVENAFTTRVDMRNRWNSDISMSGGGVLIDNGTHAVDILRFFLGNLRDVHVVEGRRLQGLPVEDTVRVFVRNDDGVMGASDLSWSIDKELETYLRIYGSNGTILVGWKESKFRQSGQEWRVFGRGYDKVQAFTDQLENFCAAIGCRASLLITPTDALASVEVIRAAYAALEFARWESVAAHVDELDIPPLSVSAALEAS